MRFANSLTQERLRQCLSYDASTGAFTHIRPAAKGWPYKPGDPAGSLVKATGYVRILIDGTGYMAHRLAWLYVTGSFPENVIDHKNGVRHDNRWENLRDVTHKVNSRKRHALNSNNTSGHPGVVYRPRQGWTAQIKVDGQQICLGFFETKIEAASAYAIAKPTLHAET